MNPRFTLVSDGKPNLRLLDGLKELFFRKLVVSSHD